MGNCHGGTKESNLTVQTTMSINDLVRIVTSGSRNISLSNLLTASVDKLVDLGFITNVDDVRLRTITDINSNYNLLITDDIVLVDASVADVGINLMLASDAFDIPLGKGYVFTIKKTDSSSNVVSIDPSGGDLVDGDATKFLIGSNNPYIHIVSDGSDWWTI